MNEMKMLNEITKFNRTEFAPFDEMLCDEIGMYCHIVATMRYYAKTCGLHADYERFNELHRTATDVMTNMYFDNIGQTMTYLIENY
jgi:hypothetical protein